MSEHGFAKILRLRDRDLDTHGEVKPVVNDQRGKILGTLNMLVRNGVNL